LLRQFRPLLVGFTGVAYVRLIAQDGVHELVVSDPGQGTIVLAVVR
jgi:hypothetical protein